MCSRIEPMDATDACEIVPHSTLISAKCDSKRGARASPKFGTSRHQYALMGCVKKLSTGVPLYLRTPMREFFRLANEGVLGGSFDRRYCNLFTVNTHGITGLWGFGRVFSDNYSRVFCGRYWLRRVAVLEVFRQSAVGVGAFHRLRGLDLGLRLWRVLKLVAESVFRGGLDSKTFRHFPFDVDPFLLERLHLFLRDDDFLAELLDEGGA